MATPEDKLLAMGSSTPMLACEKGVEEYPGYLDCENCAWTDFCDIYKTEMLRRDYNELIENQVVQDFENPQKKF